MGRLEERLAPNDVACWAASIRPRQLGEGVLVADVPSRIHLEQVRARIVPVASEALAEELGRSFEIVLEIDPRGAAPTTPAPSPGAFSRAYTFETFVTGPSNEMAYRSAREVAEHPGERFNPLFLYGGVGLGKTHVMTAVANAVARSGKRRRITFLSGEAFVNELVAALRKNAVEELRGRLRKTDVLVVDDVQFLAGKERMQEEFFHTFNALYAAQKQIVLASDQAPRKIANMEERLKSRFESGLITNIRKPDLPLRLAILARKAAAIGFELPAAVCHLVASKIFSSVRELEGALHRLAAACQLTGKAPDLVYASEVLQPLFRRPAPRTVEQVQRLVADEFRVSEQDLVRHQRASRFLLPRQVAMYLARKQTAATYSEIAASFGGRNHTTVMHAVKAVEGRRAAEPELAAMLHHLETELTG